ncbi:MAG: universal stress protein [Thiobacillus sp.]
MQSLKCIVAATDFSPAACRAVSRASVIARQQGAALHLLHVVSPLALYPGMDIGPGMDDPIRLAAARSPLDAAAQKVHERFGIHAEVAQRIGRAHSQVAEYARAVAADLVVAGALGGSFLPRFLMGATSSRLLRVCPCPVLIVRNEPVEVYRQVLAAVDFFPHTRAVAEWASLLACDGRLQLLHVLAPMDDADLRHAAPNAAAASRQRRDEMRTIAGNLLANMQSGLPGEVESRLEEGYPPALILACAPTWNTELIVVGREGRGGLEQFLLGSVSKDVVQAAECDVLVVGAA